MLLGICTIQRDRAPWIKEWVCFHYLMGFRKFYFFAHNCIDNTHEVILELTKKFDIKISIRKLFVPDIIIPWFAKGKVKQEMIEWGEILTWNPSTQSGDFVIEPNIPNEWKHYFSCHGSYSLKPVDNNQTRRVVELEFNLRIPLVGVIAERYIADQIKDWYEKEAYALRAMCCNDKGRKETANP